ncbi:MAG: sulfite exporter TauE/SafE family protein [Kiloniellaceae bacterium]
MLEPLALTAIAGVFLLAGFVKGVVGFGLPTVSLALLAVAFGLPQAMALMLVPAFVSNIWQAVAGGGAAPVLRRIWPFLLASAATIFIGALALTRVDVRWLSALLGVVLVIYAAVGLAGLRLSLTARQEAWAGPLIGAANGVLTGMTGSYVVPGVLFLQGIGLPRDQLIQAMGMLFLVSTVALGMALGGNAMLDRELALLSAAALAPTLIGMALGRSLRRRLPEAVFRRVFFAALLALGGAIIARAI